METSRFRLAQSTKWWSVAFVVLVGAGLVLAVGLQFQRSRLAIANRRDSFAAIAAVREYERKVDDALRVFITPDGGHRLYLLHEALDTLAHSEAAITPTVRRAQQLEVATAHARIDDFAAAWASADEPRRLILFDGLRHEMQLAAQAMRDRARAHAIRSSQRVARYDQAGLAANVVLLVLLSAGVAIGARHRTLRFAEHRARVLRDRRDSQAYQLANMAWWTWTPAVSELHWSEQMGPLYGRPAGWAPADPRSGEGIHPDDVERVREHFQAAIAVGGERIAPWRVVWPNGDIRWLEGDMFVETGAHPEALRAIGVVRDVTELMTLRHEAERAEEYLRTALAAMGDGVILREASTLDATLTNPAAARILGVSEDELVKPYSTATRWQLFDELGRQVPPEESAAGIALGTDRAQSARYHVERADGTRKWINVQAVPFRVGHDRQRAVMITFSDLTEVRSLQRRLESQAEALRLQNEQLARQEQGLIEAEAHFRLMATGIRDAVTLTDVAGRFEWISPSMEALLGWPPDALIGTIATDLLHPDDFARSDREALVRQLMNGELVPAVQNRLRRPDGEYLWTETSFTPVRSATGAVTGLLRVTRDISERREMEQRLRQLERMQAVGTLAGGLAHDFNNLLAVVRSTAEPWKEETANLQLRDDMSVILSACDRARGLTHQMLTFARRQVTVPVLCAVDELLASNEALLTHLVRQPGHVLLDLGAMSARVQIDPDDLVNTVMNLVSNARDATDSEQKIAVVTRQLAAEAMRPAEAPEGPVVCVSVHDAGAGMTEEVRSRACEPFFTTKPVGRGTGLGLATAHGVARHGGGTLTIDSELGVGTTVTLWLPVVTDDAPIAPPSSPMPIELAGADVVTMHILVVDDEPALARGVARLAEREGHTVTVRHSAEDAIAFLDAHADDVHALLSDFALPGQNGRMLIEHASLRWPHLQCALTSGFTADEATRSWLSDGVVPFLPKPFAFAALKALLATLASGRARVAV